MSRLESSAPLAILGGTFDPVHYGHLRLAEEVAEAVGLAQVLWIPAGQPPHRRPPHADARHRLAMVRLAIEGNSRFSLDAAEVEAPAPSYTVHTLERLRQEWPQKPLLLVLGADAFAGIASWHDCRRIFELAHVAVATRPGSAGEAVMATIAGLGLRPARSVADLGRTSAGGVLAFAITALDISATAIRGLLAQGASPRYLLPDPVLNYIGRHRLYRS